MCVCVCVRVCGVRVCVCACVCKAFHCTSRLTVVSRMAKESRINMRNHKNMTTVRIYTHNNGACIHPYQNTMLPY